MKKILLFFLLTCTGMPCFAQQPEFRWAKGFNGGEFNDNVRSIVLDGDGNVYTSGHFSGTMDFDPGPAVYNLISAGAEDMFIVKLDALGNFKWAKRWGNTHSDASPTLSIDRSGDLIISNSFVETIDADPGPGVFNISTIYNSAIFIMKLSADAELRWVKQVDAAQSIGVRVSTTDAAGNIYLGGSFTGTVDFDSGPGVLNCTAIPGFPFTFYGDVYSCKLSGDGDLVWAVSFGGTRGEGCFGITTDAAGDVILSGFFMGTADFDPGPGVNNLVSNGIEDFFIAKISGNNGSLKWARGLGGSSSDNAYSPVVASDGHIYLTGFFRNTVDFDPGPGVYNLSSSNPGDGVFILKLDNDGLFTWAREVHGPSYNNWGYHITLDRFDDVYVSGFFIGPVDFDPGPGTYILNSSGTIDGFIMKLDKSGDFKWAYPINGTGNDQSLAIVVDQYDNIYNAGHWGGPADFDPGPGNYILTAIDASDNFVQKVAQCLVTTYANPVVSACDSYTLNSHTYNSSGTYIQVIPNTAGCDSIITLDLTINHNAITNQLADICEGSSYYAGGAFQTSSGIYRDTLMTTAGCDSIIITQLTVLPAPKPDLGPDRNICTNSTITISPGTFASYLWHDNSTASSFSLGMPGQYWVTVTGSSNHCTATDTLNIIAIYPEPAGFLPADQSSCYGNPVRISVPGYRDYNWSTGSLSASVSLTTFGTFYLTVTDVNNCRGTDSIIITRKNCIPISIPNAFTPDGNGLNDIFRPTIMQEIKQYRMIVYNRYGQKIFESAQYGRGWDGRFGGRPQPNGSYVYQIMFTNIFGYTYRENGSVLIIR